MINYRPYDTYGRNFQQRKPPKLFLIYPLQSVYDIVDNQITTSDRLENLIVNAETNPRIYTFDKIHDYYIGLPTETFREIEGVVNFYKLIFLGKTDDNKAWFYSMVNHNVYTLEYGSKKFDTMDYQAMYSKLSGVPYDDAIANTSAVESFFDWDPALEADDFSFSGAEPVDDNNSTDTDNNDNGGDTTNTDNDSGGSQAVDLTAQTQDALKNDPAYGGNDGDKGFDNNNDGDSTSNMNNDANNMGDAPDGVDEDEDDNDGESDDEGTANKRRIRRNLVKLHTIIKDSLESMSTFTPAYNADAARRYYKIQGNLSTADDIIIKICNEQINDLTVDDLMKKYVTLCQIYDISTRALKVFAKEYREEAKQRGTQIKPDKTGERQKTW